MNIQGGAIEFDVLFNSGVIDRVLEETKRRLKDFSNTTVEGGAKMETAYKAATDQIEKGFNMVGNAINMNQKSITELKKKYNELGEAANAAFMKGNDSKYFNLAQQQSTVKSQIGEHKKVVTELEKADTALLQYNSDLEANKVKVDNAANAQVRFRTQLLNVKNEMMKLQQAGKINTEEFQKLTAEATRLQNAMNIANKQVKMLANPNLKFQAIVSGISGISGAFTAAQGAMGLFAEKNEDLQRIMLKVQSLMSITMGLQAVSSTLYQTSAFRLGIVAKATQWWANVMATANAALLASTAEGKAAAIAEDRLAAAKLKVAAATAVVKKQEVSRGIASAAAYARLDVAQKSLVKAQAAQVIATKAQTAASTTATVANKGLAGSFRLIGTAIKSIPGIGWLLAAIGAAVAIFMSLTSESRKAKKEAQEFNKAVAESASEQITSLKKLSEQWKRLGNDLTAKKKFLKDNATEIKNLTGIQLDLNQADELFIKNTKKYTEALILRAKAKAAEELASKKYKDAMKKEEALEKPQKPQQYIGTGNLRGKKFDVGSLTQQFGRSKTVDELLGTGLIKENTEELKDYEEKLKEYNKKVDALYSNAEKFIQKSISFSNAEKKILQSLGYSADAVLDGSIAKINESISELQKQYDLATDTVKRNELAVEIEKQRDLLKEIDILNADKDKSKDPFTKNLEEQKKQYKEYFNWVNSGREKEAQTEFASLLESGKTYREYLQKLLDSGKLTKKQIHQVTTEIANETEKTIIGEFEKDLQKQLNAARTVLEMLNIIEQRSKELTTDDPLKEQKEKILEKQNEDAIKKAEDETSKLLNDYTDYLDRKINKAIAHESQMELLRKKANKAETEDEKEKINTLIKLREQMYEAEIDNFEELEQINIDSIYRYGTYEQKRLQITKEYAKLIKTARLAGHEDVAKKLEGERDLEILKETKAYKEFFGDVSEISIKMLENTRKALLAMMKEAYESGKLTADQYKQWIDEINKQADSAYQGRGIEALFGNSKGGGIMNMMFGDGDIQTKINSFGKLFSGAKSDMANIAGSSGEVAGNANQAAGAMKGAMSGATAAISMVDAIIRAIYQTLQGVVEMLDTIAKYQESIGHSDTADSLSEWSEAISTMNNGVMNTWEKLKSGDVMGSTVNSLTWIIDMFSMFNKFHDNRIEKSIQEHADAVSDLGNTYKQLSWEIDKALGNDFYKQQKQSIENLKEQKKHLQEMANAERSKKKSDENKAKEYEEQIAEIAREISDTINEMVENILSTNAKTIAQELGDAFINAFSKGENAAAAWGNKVDDIVSNIVRNMMIQKLLEEPMGKIIDKYTSQWMDQNGNFLGWNNVQGGLSSLVTDLNNLASGFATEWENLPKELKDMFLDETAGTTSLSGAIKGITQEQASLLTGYTNAVRVNQVESIEILRNQLIQLTMINANTSKANQHLEQIEKNTSNVYDHLRSQGITGG